VAGDARSCDVAVVGAGLAGLAAARALLAAGADVLVLEGRGRVGGRTLTEGLEAEGAFIDHGGQWVSPGQERIVGLAGELGVGLFPSWDEGDLVLWREGRRQVSDGLFLPGGGDAPDEAAPTARGRAPCRAASLPPLAPRRQRTRTVLVTTAGFPARSRRSMRTR
jgi:monoamine oxidase